MYIIDRDKSSDFKDYRVTISAETFLFEDKTYIDGVTTLVKHANVTSSVSTIAADHFETYLLRTIMGYVTYIVDIDVTTNMIYDCLVETNESTGFWITKVLNSNNDAPTLAEFRDWEKGAIILYNLDVNIIVNINGVDISKSILFDIMFG